ncbi:MAG: amino-acid N-acetyltransferase [Actinobacteria bacterium]|nr:amino-acid N-acetyltransferase [Actinomycetota bacterium]
MTNLLLRPAKTSDVAFIKSLIGQYAPDRRMLKKEIMTLFEDIQEFVIAELNGEPVGYGALHVLWEDLAEVRSVAVRPEMKRHGIGRAVVEHLIERAEKLGIRRVFCLTFEVDFFGSFGFLPTDGPIVDHDIYLQMLKSEDEGVAEFLDLERVKPNTLGNTRMLLVLPQA